MPSQQSMTEFVDAMEAAGHLVRITEEIRVDQIGAVMEANPKTAVLIENIKDCEFAFLSNAYSNQDQYAWAMECTKAETGRKMIETAKGRFPTTLVDTAPCKEVILTGDDVDLALLPLFLHHDRDGHVYTNDDFVITKDANGVQDWGLYRSMWRTKDEKLFDMTCTSHRARLNAIAASERGEDLEAAIVVGGPLIDHIAALVGVPPGTDDFEVLGAFYGESARMVKCETIDIEVPANAEIVIEGHIKAVEGLIWDEGPYGEYTGMYGGGIKHNFRFVVSAMTYRKGGIYQYASIGGEHPWYTDNMLQLPAIWRPTSSAASRWLASTSSKSEHQPAGCPTLRTRRSVPAARAMPSRRWASCSPAPSRLCPRSPWCSTTTWTSGTTMPYSLRWRSATCRIATL